MNLKKMEGYTDDFFRISRSVLVNLQNITYLDAVCKIKLEK